MSKLNEFNIENPDSSTFELDHIHRTTGDFGQLIPIACIPTLPGDKFYKDNVSAFVRGMPTIAPILDKVDIKINRFYVPYRVLWAKWEEFYSRSDKHKLVGKPKPQFPTVTATSMPSDPKYPMGRLADYLGVSKYYTNKDKTEQIEPISAFPFLAYCRIYLDYFVPQRWLNFEGAGQGQLNTLQKMMEQYRLSDGGMLDFTVGLQHGDGTEDSIFKLRNVGWNHDYFTNALPTPELFGGAKMLLRNPTTTHGYMAELFYNSYSRFDPQDKTILDPAQNISNYDKLPTIKDLRKSIATQHYLDKLMYGGGRYEETTKLFWNQDLENRMLTRAEYLGGDVVPLFVSEVESTASTENAQLGELAGKPIGSGIANGDYWEADEFGIYMVTAHIVPKRSYSDAMSKALFFTKDIDELPHPDFQGIGDEAVFNYELNGQTFENYSYNSIFGYVPRYSQYKTHIDRYSGEMRTTLLHWHMGTTTAELGYFPTVNPHFITCNPREDIFQVNEPDKFIMAFGFDFKVNRKLAKNPMPGIGRI